MYKRRITILLFLILSARGFVAAQGRIGEIIAPNEICTDEEFTVVVSASALQRGINRVVVLEFPEHLKVLSVHAIDEEGNDTTSLSSLSGISSLFSHEKGRQIIAYEDHSGIYSKNFDVVLYSFKCKAPHIATTVNFKSCLVERGDPAQNTPRENTKVKTKKRRGPIMSTDWRIVSPDLFENFSFTEVIEKKYSKTVHIISGWGHNSRALSFDGSHGTSAALHADSSLLKALFAGAFTIRFWAKIDQPMQTIFEWHSATNDSIFKLTTNALGQLLFVRDINALDDTDKTLRTEHLVSDGAWHIIEVAKSNANVLWTFVDGVAEDGIPIEQEFNNIDRFTIGDPSATNSFAIDELRLTKNWAILPDPAENATITLRDTSSDIFGLFHFEDYGRIARSSVAPRKQVLEDSTIKLRPTVLYFQLDSNATIKESSSPVLNDHAILSVEQSSSTKVTFNWYATSEYNVKRYELQRRIASYGEYEKTLDIKSKQYIKPKSFRQGLLGRTKYSAVETLPPLSRNIDLYYRLALINDIDSVVAYTEPVKLEFGGRRQVFVDQNKPNPFNPKTTITFRLTKAAPVSVIVYDIIGREVVKLFDGKLTIGKHTLEVDATLWRGGIYFYKVRTPQTIVTKKMVLAK